MRKIVVDSDLAEVANILVELSRKIKKGHVAPKHLSWFSGFAQYELDNLVEGDARIIAGEGTFTADCDAVFYFFYKVRQGEIALKHLKWLANLTRKDLDLFVDCNARIVPSKRILAFNRIIPFDPVGFIGKGWSFWRGSKSGDGLGGDLERDFRIFALDEIELGEIQFKICISDNERHPTGEIYLEALRASGDIALDPKIGQALFEEPYQRALNWFYRNRGVLCIEFIGQTLRGPNGGRFFLCLHRNSDGSWSRHYEHLKDERNDLCCAAVIGDK